jgi:putative Mg2+ transporter-C (MgtC) family protein
LPGSARVRLNGVGVSWNQEAGIRLGAALLLGALFGLNRDLRGKPAGLCTHALVSLGAALATIMVLNAPNGAMAADPNAIGRVVQGILTGIGFLGAGVIMRDPAGHVTGLTTAATIWLCAVLGTVCGLGYWVLMGLGAFFTLITLLFGKLIERKIEHLFKRDRAHPPDHSV